MEGRQSAIERTSLERPVPDSVLVPARFPKPNASTKRIDWHRWFGIGLTERFDGTPWRVELEKELALKRQRLDVVIIEQTSDNAPTDPTRLDLPDGLHKLSAHNLLTYKSQQEALDAWALDELTSHYVNYRKLLAAQELLYRLFINHRLGLSAMTYTVDDFIRETHQEIIANLTPEERLRGLDPDALRSLDAEAREMLRQVLGKLK